MKHLEYFLLLFFILLNINTYSQRFKGSILAGLSTSQIDGDNQYKYKKLGLFAGVSVATEFSEVMGGKIELYYIEKGAKKIVGGIEEFKTKLHYVEMPFLLTIKPIDRFEFDIGMAISYLISAKLIQQGSEVPDGLYDMHNFDFGGIASASYFFSNNVGINIRVFYSIFAIKNNPNWYNSNLSFGLGYKINNSK